MAFCESVECVEFIECCSVEVLVECIEYTFCGVTGDSLVSIVFLASVILVFVDRCVCEKYMSVVCCESADFCGCEKCCISLISCEPIDCCKCEKFGTSVVWLELLGCCEGKKCSKSVSMVVSVTTKVSEAALDFVEIKGERLLDSLFVVTSNVTKLSAFVFRVSNRDVLPPAFFDDCLLNVVLVESEFSPVVSKLSLMLFLSVLNSAVVFCFAVTTNPIFVVESSISLYIVI